MSSKLDRLRFGGYFTVKEAEEKNLRLVTGRSGMFCLYWLVDEADGIICDAKFQAFGPPVLIVLGEIISELALRKTYDQVSRISADLIDARLCETFPSSKGGHSFMNQALDAIARAVHQCIDIPYAATDFKETPIAWDLTENSEGLEGWDTLSSNQKIKVLEEVIDKEIRPYIELDAGGIKIVELKENGELHIAYEGSCTTCLSSTGSTLSAIQKIVKARVHPNLQVIPV